MVNNQDAQQGRCDNIAQTTSLTTPSFGHFEKNRTP